nr:glycosyltransferase [uncultured Lachnoclostridium sp.]
MNPKISVVMPVYNTKAAYLKEAVNSILNQSFSGFELIIVDDGSSNSATLSCLDSFTDPRIKLTKFKTNQGASSARNYGLKQAIGKYIALMDSDDISKPNRFAEQVKYLDEHQECGLVASLINVIGNDKTNFAEFPYISSQKDIESFLLFKGCCFCNSSVMFRKSVIESNKLQYNSKFDGVEDYEFWCQFVGKTAFTILKQKLVDYRYHFDNITHRNSNKNKDKMNLIISNNLCRVSDNRISNKIFNEFINGKIIESKDLNKFVGEMTYFINKLANDGYSSKFINALFYDKVRNLFYHSEGFNKQLVLFNSKLAKYFNLPWYWKLFCLITRSIRFN